MTRWFCDRCNHQIDVCQVPKEKNLGEGKVATVPGIGVMELCTPCHEALLYVIRQWERRI